MHTLRPRPFLLASLTLFCACAAQAQAPGQPATQPAPIHRPANVQPPANPPQPAASAPAVPAKK